METQQALQDYGSALFVAAASTFDVRETVETRSSQTTIHSCPSSAADNPCAGTEEARATGPGPVSGTAPCWLSCWATAQADQQQDAEGVR